VDRETIYHQVKERELKRFGRALDEAVDSLLAAKFNELRNYEAYNQYVETCQAVKAIVRFLDGIADKLAPLFERRQGRSAWDVYLSGLRRLHRQWPESHFSRQTLTGYKLDDLNEKLTAFSGKVLEQLGAAQKALQHVDAYLDNLAAGQDIAEAYQNQSEDLPRLYASLKTWATEDDWQRLYDDLAAFLDQTIEVIVIGPIQLYLMLRRDTFLLIFKALSLSRLGEERDDAEYREVMAWHDFIYSLVEGSATRQILGELLRRAVQAYLADWRQEHTRLRDQLPRRELRERFIERYETGALFREERWG